jgi:hypothetical protein
MDFPDETQAKWKMLKTFQPIVHRPDVIDHFSYIFGSLDPFRVYFKLENIFEGALRPFDLGAENGLVANIHGNKKIRIR